MRGRAVELIVFWAGVATLGGEIAVARLIAPAFGESTVVWANTIAVVLVALAIGSWIGGRLADRRPDPRALAALTLAGAVLLAVVPLAAVPLLGSTEDVLREFSGSLVAVVVLLALPVLILGAVAPYAVRLRLQAVERTGDAAGRVYALSTAGSLVGTFGATLGLIPLVGTALTFVVLAALLALATLPGWVAPRQAA
jgi:predicted membrane-bound spermidine synthase